MATKQDESFGFLWDQVFSYVRVVKHGNMIHLAGQFSRDSVWLVAPAPVDERGQVTDYSTETEQIRTTCANATELLAPFGAMLDNVAEDVDYVPDVDSAFAASGPVRKDAFGTETPQVATILVTPRLAFPDQLAEFSLTAKPKE